MRYIYFLIYFLFLKRFSGDVRVPGSKWTSGELLALLTALEEWFGDSSDKLIDPINPDSLINNWNSVSQYVRSKSADGMLKLLLNSSTIITNFCVSLLYRFQQFYY